MSACLADRRLRRFAAVVVTAATAMAPALPAAGEAIALIVELAQARGGPIPLGPPVQLVPQPTVPPAAPAEQATSEPPRPRPMPTLTIEVGKPAEFDSDSIGVLDENRGGFPADLWDGTSRLVLRKLLSELPGGTKSAAMRELVRRALLTSAQAPALLPGASQSETPSLVGLRAQRLMAMGLVGAAADLAKAVPGRLEDEALARILLDAAWMVDDRDGACKLVRGQISRMASLYWQQALVVCQALGGEHERAALGLSLMREQRLEEDPALAHLVAAIAGAGGGARLNRLEQPTLLHLALLRAAGQPLPDDLGTSSDPLLLRVFAQTPESRRDVRELRLAAAERAEALGALVPAQLAEVWDSLRLLDEQVAGAARFVERNPTPLGRALLYRAIKSTRDVRTRIDLIRLYLRVARDQNVHPTAARLLLPLMRAVPPRPEFADFGGEAVRALLIAGAADEARAWYDLIEGLARRDPAMAAEKTLLWPLLRIAGGDNWAPSEPGRIEQWLSLQRQREPAKAPARAAVLAAMFSALQEGETGALATALAGGAAERDQGRMPPSGLWVGLKQAAAQGRLGETILVAAILLGPEGTAGAGALTIGAVLAALRAVGQEPDARLVAIEAALAAGL